jgi:vancomycin permeability regulator SanA
MSGKISMGFPFPFSLFVTIVFILLCLGAIFQYRKSQTKMFGKTQATTQAKTQGKATTQATTQARTQARQSDGRKVKPAWVIANRLSFLLTIVLVFLLFPLAQILCFGTTTYNGKTDATVVLGAQVLPSGQPSDVLRDRLDKAIEVYHQGKTKMLIMSGGIDIGGTDEAMAMRDYALGQGVPASAILVDSGGNNTQATAHDVVAMMRENHFSNIAAVSNFYHLARIKLLFLDAGSDVMTIPCSNDSQQIATLIREVPAWWYYWLITLVE